MPFALYYQGFVWSYTRRRLQRLTEAYRRHKAPHRITSKGLDALRSIGQLSVSGVRSPLGQPSGVRVARLFSHPMLLTAMRITAGTHTPLQMPGSAGKGRFPMCT